MGEVAFLDNAAFMFLALLAERKHYLRELAESTGFSPSFVHKVMLRLVKEGLVLVEKQKNRKVFLLNYNSPLATRALSIVFVRRMVRAKAFQELIKLKPFGVYLFGTAASGKITADSDIDLAVFFNFKPDYFKLSDVKRRLSSELKREVQLVVLTPKKIESMKSEQTELLSQIKIGCIVLWGELFD